METIAPPTPEPIPAAATERHAQRNAEKLEHRAALHRKLGHSAIDGATGELNPFAHIRPEGFREKRAAKHIHEQTEKRRIAHQKAQRHGINSVARMSKSEKKQQHKDIDRKVKAGDMTAAEAYRKKWAIDQMPTGKSKATKRMEKAQKKERKLTRDLERSTFRKADRLDQKAAGLRSRADTSEALVTAPESRPASPRPEIYDWEKEAEVSVRKPYDWAEDETPKEKTETSSPFEAPNPEDIVVRSYVNAEGRPLINPAELAQEITKLAAGNDRARLEQALGAYVDAFIHDAWVRGDREDLQNAETFVEQVITEFDKLNPIQSKSAPEATPVDTVSEGSVDANIARTLDKRIGQRIASELRNAGDISKEQKGKLIDYVRETVIAEHLGIDREMLGDPKYAVVVKQLSVAINLARKEFEASRKQGQGNRTPRQGGGQNRPNSRQGNSGGARRPRGTDAATQAVNANAQRTAIEA